MAYVIAITAQHDAVDYSFFKQMAKERNFDLYITRNHESKRRNMTLVPTNKTEPLDLVDVINELESNSPLLITFEIQQMA